MPSELANRYGQGLFLVARDNDTVESKKEQAEELLKVIDETPQLLTFLEAVQVTDDEKKEVLKKSLGEAVDVDVLHLLELLIDKNRIWYLREILEAYVALADEHLGILRGQVVSARKLADQDMERIRAALEKQYGRSVFLSNRIDPSVIAGIKVIIDGKVTDVTMKARIDAMRDALLKGGQA